MDPTWSQQSINSYEQGSHLGKVFGKQLVVKGNELECRRLSVKETIKALFNKGPASNSAIEGICTKNSLVHRTLTPRNRQDYLEETMSFKQGSRVDLIERTKFPLSTKDDNGDTWLHHACSAGDVAAARAILTKDKKVIDLRNNDMETPLMIAAQNDNQALVDLILEQENVTITSCDAAITYAIDSGHIDLAEHIARRIGDRDSLQTIAVLKGERVDLAVFRNILFDAARLGKTELIKKMLSAYPAGVYILDNQGRTALHIAALSGQFEAVQLLDRPGIINNQDKAGKTALMYARADEDIREYLISKGAKIDFYTQRVREQEPKKL